MPYPERHASAGRHQQAVTTPGGIRAPGLVAASGRHDRHPRNWGKPSPIVEASRRGWGAWVATRLWTAAYRQGFTIIPYLDPLTANWLGFSIPQGLNDPCGDCHPAARRWLPDSGGRLKVTNMVTRTGYPLSVAPCSTLPDGRGLPSAGRGGVRRTTRRAVGAVGSGRAAVCPSAAQDHGSVSGR